MPALRCLREPPFSSVRAGNSSLVVYGALVRAGVPARLAAIGVRSQAEEVHINEDPSRVLVGFDKLWWVFVGSGGF